MNLLSRKLIHIAADVEKGLTVRQMLAEGSPEFKRLALKLKNEVAKLKLNFRNVLGDIVDVGMQESEYEDGNELITKKYPSLNQVQNLINDIVEEVSDQDYIQFMNQGGPSTIHHPEIFND